MSSEGFRSSSQHSNFGFDEDSCVTNKLENIKKTLKDYLQSSNSSVNKMDGEGDENVSTSEKAIKMSSVIKTNHQDCTDITGESKLEVKSVMHELPGNESSVDKQVPDKVDIQEPLSSKSSTNVDKRGTAKLKNDENVDKSVAKVSNSNTTEAVISAHSATEDNRENDFVGAKLIGLGNKMDPSHMMIEITRSVFKMGRSFDADITIKDINVSREQALFENKHGTWTILDNSSNGIRVNGMRIVKGEPFSLNFQDKILFSDQQDKYFWKFISISDKENDESFNWRKRKMPQADADKRIKLNTSHSDKVPLKLLESERNNREKILRKMEAEKIERERAEKMIEEERLHRLQMEKTIQEERLQREEVEKKMKKEREEREEVMRKMEEEKREREEALREMQKEKEEREQVERKMEEERAERENMVKLMEQERKERESLTRQLKEQKLALETERQKLEEEISRITAEKDRIELEQRKSHQEMSLREQQAKEEMRKKEEENKEKQEQILKRIEEERERASITAEDVQKKENRIAELELAMEAARQEADAIILQEKEAREKIANEMVAEKERLETEKLKFEEEMTNLRAEKDRVEAEKNTKVAEVLQEQERKETERKNKEEENLIKQQEILAQIETEKARAAHSEEENKMKEARIEQLQLQMASAVEEAQYIKEQGAREVLERMEGTLEEQLICSACLELPIHPVILNCGHSNCWLCLQQWKRANKNSLCPQCRVKITVETRGISIDNMIEAFISQLGPDKVNERKEKVAERCENEQKFRDEEEANNTGRRNNRGRGRNQRGGRNTRGRGGGQPEVRYAGPAPNNTATTRGLPGAPNNERQNINHQVRQPINAPLQNYQIPRIQSASSNPRLVAQGAAVQPAAAVPQAASYPRPVHLVSSSNGQIVLPMRGAAPINVTAGRGGTVRMISVLPPNADNQPSARLLQIRNFGIRLAAQASASRAAGEAGTSGIRVVTSARQINPSVPGPSGISDSVVDNPQPGTSASSSQSSQLQPSTSGSSGSRPSSAASNSSEPAANSRPSSSSSIASRVIYVSSDDENSDDNYAENSPTGLSESDYDSDASDVPGLPGFYYGGYGHCYACGRTGHWAPGCPL